MSAASAESVERRGLGWKTYPAVCRELNVCTVLTRAEKGYTKGALLLMQKPGNPVEIILKLLIMYSLPNSVRVVKSRRMRWAGLVARVGEARVVHRVLVGKPEGKNH